MNQIQATWIPEGRLFFWSNGGDIVHVADYELPTLKYAKGQVTHRSLAFSGESIKRKRTRGVELELSEVITLLTPIQHDDPVSDSILCWSMATKLALKLAAAQRAVPTVLDSQSRWKALLTSKKDHAQFKSLEEALPTVNRALPTRDRGHIRLASNAQVLRGFIDRTIDALYRQDAYPGSTRGWALEFAESLRSSDPYFSPREARNQGVVELINAWSATTTIAALTVGFELQLSENEEAEFPLTLWIHPSDQTTRRSIDEVWKAGKEVTIGTQTYPHPAHNVLRGLARASRLYTPLRRCLNGTKPKNLVLTSAETWEFLSNGVPSLIDAGFEVDIPHEFSQAGKRRIRARIRIEAPESGEIDLANALDFRWEIALGDTVITGAEFQHLIQQKTPILKFRGQWVILDPMELDRLPSGMEDINRMPTAEALKAVLTGMHHGVPVVADDRLQIIINAIKAPPDCPPPDNLEGTLRPYQLKGYAWLRVLGKLGIGACLADDMGLGKTIQLIAHMLERTNEGKGPHLVVCPTSVLGNWKREINRFAPSLKVTRFHGLQRGAEQLHNANVSVTTYGLLVRDLEVLKTIDWDVIVLDEAQAIKNPDSQRARSARDLPGRHRVALSGTPVENRLDELWSLMHFLIPNFLGPRGRFRRNVAVPIERFGDKFISESLKIGISPFLLRRVKTDPTVIDDLPEKIERREYTPLTTEQATLYRQVMSDSMNRISRVKDIERRGHVLAMLTALKQVCNHPEHYLNGDGPLADRSGKLLRCEAILDHIFARREHALIFTQYRAMGVRLQTHLQQRYRTVIPFLHGGTTATNREEMVRVFQNDKDAPPILLISLRAGGTGLNLTRATHVLHYDRWWNPAVEDQATDRAYRIGQKQNVQVYKLITQGTLEERIDQMLEEKRSLANQVVGSGERWVTDLDDDALRRLIALGEDAVLEE